jgi:hypothetical protein
MFPQNNNNNKIRGCSLNLECAHLKLQRPIKSIETMKKKRETRKREKARRSTYMSTYILRQKKNYGNTNIFHHAKNIMFKKKIL